MDYHDPHFILNYAALRPNESHSALMKNQQLICYGNTHISSGLSHMGSIRLVLVKEKPLPLKLKCFTYSARTGDWVVFEAFYPSPLFVSHLT